MTPLDATATSAAINADSDRTGDVVLEILLKFSGVTPSVANIRRFLDNLGGIPRLPTLSAVSQGNSANTLRANYNSLPTTNFPESTNLVPNPSFEVDDAGWIAQGGGASVARITTEGCGGSAGVLQVTCTGAGANEGVILSPAVDVPAALIGQSLQVAAAGAAKSVSGSTALRLIIVELDTADSVLATTNLNFTANTSTYNYQASTSALTLNASTAKLQVGIVTQGTTAAVFNVGAFALAALLGTTPMGSALSFNAPTNADPTNFVFPIRMRCNTLHAFHPDRIYEVADAVWATVASDKDAEARGVYQLTITA